MHTDDRVAVVAVLDAMAEAWGRHDAEAYGELFTEDAAYVTFVGTHYRGRREIAASHRVLWAKYLKGTRLAGVVDEVRFPVPDVAVVVGRGDVHKGKPPRRLGKVQTTVLVREGGRWRVTSFHDTKRKALLEAISFRTSPELAPQVRV